MSHLSLASPPSNNNPSDITGLTGTLDITLSSLSRTFHPVLTITIRPSFSSPPPQAPGCYALISLSLPDEIFIDKDELGDRWGIRASIMRPFEDDSRAGPSRPRQHTSGTSAIIPALKAWTVKPDIIDIERPVRAQPVYVRNKTGDWVEEVTRLNMAFESKAEEVRVEIPLHGRYLIPGRDGEGEREVVVFGEGGGEIRGGWMCAMSEDPDKIYAIPPPPPDDTSSKRKLCFDIPVPPLPLLNLPTSPILLTLPMGTASHQLPVEVITAVSIWLGWAYLIWKIWRYSRGDRLAGDVTRPGSKLVRKESLKLKASEDD